MPREEAADDDRDRRRRRSRAGRRSRCRRSRRRGPASPSFAEPRDERRRRALRDELSALPMLSDVARGGGDDDAAACVDRDAGDRVVELAAERCVHRRAPVGVELGDERVAERRALVDTAASGSPRSSAPAANVPAIAMRSPCGGDALDGVGAGAADADEPRDLAGRRRCARRSRRCLPALVTTLRCRRAACRRTSRRRRSRRRRRRRSP